MILPVDHDGHDDDGNTRSCEVMSQLDRAYATFGPCELERMTGFARKTLWAWEQRRQLPTRRNKERLRRRLDVIFEN